MTNISSSQPTKKGDRQMCQRIYYNEITIEFSRKREHKRSTSRTFVRLCWTIKGQDKAVYE